LFTFTVSLSVEDTVIERGPTGRSDSGEIGDRVRLGLGVRVVLAEATELSTSRFDTFLERAMDACIGKSEKREGY